MKRFGSLWWVFALSTTPFLLGSAIFFYWYYSREWLARDADIESAAFLAILLYGLFGLVAMGLLINHCIRERTKWSLALCPMFILAVTWAGIDLYSTTYSALRARVYVRVVERETGPARMTVWSAHFEQALYVDHDDRDFLFSYQPTYTYDWGREDDSMGPDYTVDSVFIEIHKDGITRCWLLPQMERGHCRTLTMNEVTWLQESRSREVRYGGPFLGR